MKKKTLYIAIFGAILIVLRLIIIFPQIKILNSSEVVNFYKQKLNFEDENLNTWIRDNSYANKSIKEKINKIKHLIPTNSKWFEPNSEAKLLSEIESIVPNNIEKLKNDLINYRIQNIWIKRFNKKPIELEELMKYAYPIAPNVETIRETAIYWYLLSRYFEKIGDFDNSIKISIGILYLARDWEREYDLGLSPMNKSLTQEFCRIGCKSILKWASKPKPKQYSLSKEYAKIILDYVKNEYPASVCVKYGHHTFEDVLESSNLKYQFKNFYHTLCSVKKTKAYAQIIKEVFEEPISYIDKPLYEIKDKLGNYQNRVNKLLSGKNFWVNNISLFFESNGTLTSYLVGINKYDFFKMKCSQEQKLAELEFTAIALAINSYFSQNNKMPDNIEELNKWFGRELPKNRLTNEPYEFNVKIESIVPKNEFVGKSFETETIGKHLLYNYGVDGVPDLELENTDDIYFDFSM